MFPKICYFVSRQNARITKLDYPTRLDGLIDSTLTSDHSTVDALTSRPLN